MRTDRQDVLRFRRFLRCGGCGLGVSVVLSAGAVVVVEGWTRRLRARGYNSFGSIPKSLQARSRSEGMAPARFARFAYSCALSNSCSTTRCGRM